MAHDSERQTIGGHTYNWDGTICRDCPEPGEPAEQMKVLGLPDDAAARKGLPLYTFLMQYFPDAFVEVARVSVIGNQQHNPGEPLHWARNKSTDQMDSAFRHMFDYGKGKVKDKGMYVLAQAAWRIMAELQLLLEREQEAAPTAKRGS